MSKEKICILAGWLIDGSGTAAQRRMKIELENGYIRSIGKLRESLPDSINGPRAFLDFSDCTFLPALVDCHVHLAMPEACESPVFVNGSADEYHRIDQRLNQYLAMGIAAVRDGGDAQGRVQAYKSGRAGFKNHAVHLRTAGKARHRSGRYGHWIGCALPPEQTLAENVFQEKEGIDHIKIVNSGLNSLTVFGRQTRPQFDTAEMKAAIQAAGQRGFKTMVHANGEIPVKIAVEAGCDSIEHGFFMGKENLLRMADRGTFWVPTVLTMKALGNRMKRRRQPVDVVSKNLEHQIEQIQTAAKLGVRMALGTDSGSAGVGHGQAHIGEMQLLVDAGYPIEKAVQCASHHGAVLLGLPRVGLVRKDWQATFIAVKGDPSRLPESLNKIQIIFNKGKQINKNIK